MLTKAMLLCNMPLYKYSMWIDICQNIYSNSLERGIANSYQTHVLCVYTRDRSR